MRVTLAVAVACLTFGGLAAAGDAAAAIRKETHIPAEGLGPALTKLAKEFDFQVLYRTEIVSDLKSPGATGALTSDEALDKVLTGTGLTYKYLDDKTVTIIPMSAAGSGQPTAANASGSSDDANASKEAGKKTSQDFRVAQLDQGKNAGTSSVGEENSAPQENSKSPPTAGLAEIIVTAQKRTEREQDVPASISVLSGSQLEDEGVAQLSDYAKQVPGLSLFGNSGPGQGEVVLRGISSGYGSSALVGVYLDDVPMRPSSPNSNVSVLGFGFDPDLADIERIEVLEGPQSTLYGASSMGGVLKFVTKQPDMNSSEGSVRVDGSQVDGGGAGYGVRGSINIPIVPDTVGLRAAAFYRDDPGFVDNKFYGLQDVNHDSVKGVRLSLRVNLSDDLQTTLSGIAQNIDGLGQNLVYLNPATLQPALGGLSYSSAFNQGVTVANRSLSDTTTLNVHFATLTNVASYATVVGRQAQDYTSYGSLVALPSNLLVVTPYTASTRRFSDELRLLSSPGRFEWLLGAFYTHEKDPDYFPSIATNSVGVPLPRSSPNYNVYTYSNAPIFDEKAIFGDGTFHITDHIEGTVGARYSVNHQSFDYTGTGLLAGPSGIGGQGESRGSATTYLGTMSYKPTSETSVYVRAASAYRPGAPNILAPFQVTAGAPLSFGPDKLWNYEAGVKGSVWDRHITYSADVYHMVWTDIQLNVYIDGGTVVANAASAKSDGAEASLQLAIEGLTLNLNAAYTDAKLTSNIPAPISAANGDPLPYAPKVTAATVVDYRFAALKGVVPRAGLTYAYHGSEDTAFTTGTGAKLPSYETLDLRSGVDWSRYSLIARIENVTNRYALTDAEVTLAGGTPLGGIAIRPRTFGISFMAHF